MPKKNNAHYFSSRNCSSRRSWKESFQSSRKFIRLRKSIGLSKRKKFICYPPLLIKIKTRISIDEYWTHEGSKTNDLNWWLGICKDLRNALESVAGLLFVVADPSSDIFSFVGFTSARKVATMRFSFKSKIVIVSGLPRSGNSVLKCLDFYWTMVFRDNSLSHLSIDSFNLFSKIFELKCSSLWWKAF